MVTDTSLRAAVPESRPAWWWQTRLYEQPYLKAAQRDGDRHVSTSSSTWKPPNVMVTDTSLRAAVPESRPAWWWQTRLYEQQYLKAAQRDGDRHDSTSSSTWKPPSVMVTDTSLRAAVPESRPAWWWQTRLYEQLYLKAAQRDGDRHVSTSSCTWKPPSVMVTDTSLRAAVPESRPAWWWQTRLYEQLYLKAAQRDGDRHVSTSSSTWKPPSVMVTDTSLRAAVLESCPAWWWQTRLYEQQYLKAAQRDGQTHLYLQQYLKAAQCDGDRCVSTSSSTWKPPSVMVTDTSSGLLTTPATDLTRDMKSRGNQTIQMSSITIIPPIPYFTTFFFFCPRGWGYLWKHTSTRESGGLVMSYCSILKVFIIGPNTLTNTWWLILPHQIGVLFDSSLSFESHL